MGHTVKRCKKPIEEGAGGANNGFGDPAGFDAPAGLENEPPRVSGFENGGFDKGSGFGDTEASGGGDNWNNGGGISGGNDWNSGGGGVSGGNEWENPSASSTIIDAW